MFNTKTVEIEWGGKTLKLETGRVARQADGAVLATLGETVVLCAVTAAKNVKPGQDFFPLTVHYQEKFSAAGRIPGGFFKRERGATEKETLTSRLIDRPIQPVIDAIIKLAEQAAKEPWELAPSADKAAIKAKLKELIGADIEAAYRLTNKSERSAAINAARAKAAEAFAESDPQEQLVA